MFAKITLVQKVGSTIRYIQASIIIQFEEGEQVLYITGKVKLPKNHLFANDQPVYDKFPMSNVKSLYCYN